MSALEEYNSGRTHKKQSQQEIVYNYIKDMGGLITTNQLRAYGQLVFIAEANRRARELRAKGRLTSRYLTDDEMAERGLKTRVVIYEISLTNDRPSAQSSFL
jgi:hypothetical protein